MDVDTTAAIPTRVEELWFSDSGLVVQAEQSLFRVSGAVLAARSLVFKDMLSFTQPPDAANIDGCPIVRLPDSAVDVAYFLRAIFDSSFFEPHPSKTELDIVISILHMSNKYAVDYLLRRALAHLSSEFPTTLAGHDLDVEQDPTSMTIGLADLDAATVACITIAREVNALWLLPSLFYQLASTDDVGIPRVLNCVAHNHSPAKLSEDDRILFLKSSLQVSRQGNYLVRFLHSPDTIPGCERGKKCTRVRLEVLEKAQTRIIGKYSANPLSMFNDSMDEVLLGGCCGICYRFCRKAHREARQAIWDELPSFCDLPPWAELEIMKASALAP
ncbi:hypothetical protein B0H19DRAFT_1067279 [Mycena capillaripes]|nr:hypothetical protein B0H19DRAFT_1067279 [Mycena capillaripes]